MSKEVFATYLDDVARVQEFYGSLSTRSQNVRGKNGSRKLFSPVK